MVVYDVSNEKSFQSCKKWIKNVHNANPEKKIPCKLICILLERKLHVQLISVIVSMSKSINS